MFHFHCTYPTALAFKWAKMCTCSLVSLPALPRSLIPHTFQSLCGGNVTWMWHFSSPSPLYLKPFSGSLSAWLETRVFEKQRSPSGTMFLPTCSGLLSDTPPTVPYTPTKPNGLQMCIYNHPHISKYLHVYAYLSGMALLYSPIWQSLILSLKCHLQRILSRKATPNAIQCWPTHVWPLFWVL